MSVAKRNSAAGLQHARDAVEIVVARRSGASSGALRPGIGIEQVDAGQRGRRAASRAARAASPSKRRTLARRRGRWRAPALGHAVDEGLDADEADVGIGDRPRRSDARRRRSRSRAGRRRPVRANSAARSAGAGAARSSASAAARRHQPGLRRRAAACPCGGRGARRGGMALAAAVVAHRRQASRRLLSVSERGAERVGEVGLLPGEAAIGLRRAAEMAVGRGARVDRPVERRDARGCRAATGP